MANNEKNTERGGEQRQSPSERFEREHPRDKAGADAGQFKPAPQTPGTLPEDSEG